MDRSPKMAPQTSLFQVYLRLRPPTEKPASTDQAEQWLVVEPPVQSASNEQTSATSSMSTHVTLQPPNDSRKRAVERFNFTKILNEQATQLDIFEETEAINAVSSLIQEGRDGLIATLGVSGSGKTHTILGSRSQRGLTQMTLDVLFRSIGQNIRRVEHPDLPSDTELVPSLQACDPSEAQVMSATSFLESVYGDFDRLRHSRAQTPMHGGGSRAQTPMTESMGPPSLPRRHLPARSSALPQIPDVSNYAVEIDRRSEYVVLVSMYEVYNDRIFDLLSAPMQSNTGQMTTRQGAVLQKALSRRPLLFKSTEMSPDHKVVAGLRKILCASYDEAMMVLEAGLVERRVAGTGSNSVSSRSHGFFCIEVKRHRQSNNYGSNDWSGGTLSIVDLAGSERARNAKTTGSTLAEAGKINESLMYLGQCLQVQSDCQQDGSKPIVPFRQCKLTELLFSNSFPSTTSHHTTYRTPQKAIMIVTADPHGDFNATSQILRYSALAREVTVPRIPSVTSTILTTGTSNNKQTNGGRDPPYAFSAEELEQAANEIARLSDECDQMAMRLAEEVIRRRENELRLQAAEEKAILVEQGVREECWAEMEARLEEEKKRWRMAWDEEREKSERYLDGKIEILENGAAFGVYEDVGAEEAPRIEVVERENEQLRARVEALERELHQRSPSKRMKPKTQPILQENSNPKPTTNPFLSSLRGSFGDDSLLTTNLAKPSLKEMSPRKASLGEASTGAQEEAMSPRKVSAPKTPGTLKKQRKLTTRKWDLGEVASDGEY